MATRISHRGPDDSGVWVDTGIGLAHRRLAIVDLSQAGHQPMHSASGRYTVVYNGEIYNHRSLRAQLDREGKRPAGGWRGTSDTEVLLAAIDAYGVNEALERITGMFAIALWDAKSRKLILIRDRFGEKPLYFAFAANSLLFASDLSALKAHPDFVAQIEPEAVAALLRRNYIPAPLSIYRDCWKLLPGSMLEVELAKLSECRQRLSDVQSHGQPGSPVRRYWDLQAATVRASTQPFASEREALDALDGQFRETLTEQYDADVPVGAFLSGGVDSSAVVALLQHHAGVTAKTFTIGFSEADYDEGAQARCVADYLGTEHREISVTPVEAMEVIRRLPEIYSEPFADSSQIPTFLVSELARRHVTVALSGDAGDELFGGYNRHVWAERTWPHLAMLPVFARRTLGKLMRVAPIGFWRAVAVLPGPLNLPELHLKAQKAGRILRASNGGDEIYAALLDEWEDGRAPTRAPSAWPLVPDLVPELNSLPLARRMMIQDALSYLPDDILCKVDRAAMAHSLETRCPLLDHRLAELTLRLPMNMLIRGNTSKWALRQLLYRHVPRELIERPKSGFGIPVGEWLRGPLREWAENLLEERALQDSGYLEPTPIRQRWKAHLAGRGDFTSSLWGVLMLQGFLRQSG
jgi:asparagine synthase (glutamine-hydrolysing)